MRLSSIEVQGFKSFPEKTRLSFGDGITAVVGPNGSGKSNIADAVRWALGEQSTRTLRGSKMEDVIFGGTQNRKPVGYAAVSLTIDNAGRELNIEEDSVTITRRLFRSGESEYRINSAMVRLKDVHELFMDTGLGRDGYSIIGQGRIAEIVSSKPSGRREIFEEAAGIAKHRYRKEEAEKKLGQAEDNLLRLRDILLELESRVGPLREQSEKARTFLELSEEKKSLEISVWIVALEKLKTQIAEQENKVFICKNDYERLEGQAQDAEEQINEAFSRSQQLLLEAETLRAGLSERQKAVSRGEAEIAVLRNDIAHNEQNAKRVEDEMSSADVSADELAAQISQKCASLEESAKNLEYLDGKISAAEQRMQEQRELQARLNEEILGYTVRRNSLNEAANEAKLEMAAGAGLIEEGLKRLETLGASRGAHDAAVDGHEKAIAECWLQIEEEEDKISSLENMAGGFAIKRRGKAEKLEERNTKMNTLRQSAVQKRQKAKLLEDMEASMEGFVGSVKYILGEARRSAISGVYGAVSSLIDVDAEYATAIETALGPAMQNIIVEDEDTAKRAMRMLQSARAGRATFLPLTSVSGGGNLPESELKRTQGFIGAASGLVRVDNRFKGIISHLLGRVAIAEDLEAATRIAKARGYRFRLVTLDGQVINAGGSYTGGSNVKSAGTFGRRHEIERLNTETERINAEIEALAPGVRTLTEELAALDAQIAGAAAEEKTAREEKMRLGFSLETLEKELAQAKCNRDLAAKELKQLTERMEELKGDEAGYAKAMEELGAELKGIDEKLESASGRRNSLQTGVETASQALSEQKLDKMTAEKDHELLEQEIARLREVAENAGSRMEQLKAERDGYLAANTELLVKIEATTEQRRTQKAEIEKDNGKIAELMAKRTEIEGETTALRNREKELAAGREKVSRELARLDERRFSLQADLDSIVAKLWDEYELTRREAAALAKPLQSIDKANRRLSELRGKIKALGTVNVAAIEEYKQVSERFEFLTAQIKDVESAKNGLIKLLNELTAEMRDIFTQNFAKIAENFTKVFAELFGGGRAELSLTQEEDVLESGVEIFVQPPGKIIKNLTLLSGGEQAFVAIAIYFAILKVRPAPFCLLDEIEAALDDVNVVRFASYLRQMSRNTQFIAITHRRGTMEEADVLYGVTMQEEGVSKLLNLNVAEVELKLGIREV